ncbi:MAG: hypothetical protein V7K20_12545, partial [Nostoc sp.]
GEGEAGVGCFSFLLRMIIILLFGDFIPWKSLIGNALNNTLKGLAGNDLLIGNGGDDILDGGDGIDTVSYRRSFNSSNIGVSVDLANNIAFDGIDGLDTLRNIENIIGSQFADRLW